MTTNSAVPWSAEPSNAPTLIIDCDRCSVRGLACTDCVVSVLLGPPGVLDHEAQTAIAVLAGSGLVPPLRLVTNREDAALADDVTDVA